MNLNDPDAQRGLYQKYAVYKIVDAGDDMETEKPVEEFTFTLVPEHDPIAYATLRSYAVLCREKNPQLSADLITQLDAIRIAHDNIIGGQVV